MRKAFGGLLAVLGAALWPAILHYVPEFIRAAVYERVLHKMNPYIDEITLERVAYWGPMLGFALIGFFLFWKTYQTKAASAASAAYDTPIAKAIAHVAQIFDDRDASNCFPRARQAVRQAALDGEIKIRGNKSARPMGEGGGRSAVETDIPREYWETADIGPMATSETTDANFHTFPHQFTDGAFGELIVLYARLRLSWDEVLRRWPQSASVPSLPTWFELEQRFRELEPALQFSRIDGQTGAAGEHWRIAGGVGRDAQVRFNATAAMASSRLLRDFPDEVQRHEELASETDPSIRWYKALQYIGNRYEHGPVAQQIKHDGSSEGFLYSGSIDKPATASATLCLELASRSAK